MSKTRKLLAYAGLGALPGIALIILTYFSPQGIHGALVDFLLVPASLLHALRLDFLMGPAFSPNASDDVGLGALFLFTVIIWPLIGAGTGALTAHFSNQRIPTIKTDA